MGFQGLEQGNPIDAGRFHSDRLDAAVDEPVRQGSRAAVIGTKSTHALLLVTVRHTGHDFMRANIAPQPHGD